VTRLLIDRSVLIKWFHSAGESEVVEARAIRDAHVRGDLDAHVLDLAIYEVGNVLAPALKWTAVEPWRHELPSVTVRELRNHGGEVLDRFSRPSRTGSPTDPNAAP